MSPVPEPLLAVQRDIKAGKRRWVKVKTLLAWFRQKGRGKYVVQTIQEALDEVRLVTDPAFTSGGVHDYIEFRASTEPRRSSRARSTSAGDGDAETKPGGEGREKSRKSSHGTTRRSSEAVGSKFCIGMFEAANRPDEVLTIARDKTVEEATTMMLTRNYSQLPVTQNKRDIDGMISWRSIGRARVKGAACRFVRDCLEEIDVLDQDAPFFKAVEAITEREVVLVLGRDRTITGIVTTADLSREYNRKAAPFLLLGEVEDRIRVLISNNLSIEEIKRARDPADGAREIEDASDLTFGEYVKLLESRENWEKLRLSIDRKLFVELLNEVREVRNDVMHFRPDSTEPENLDKVRQLHSLLEQLVQ